MSHVASLLRLTFLPLWNSLNCPERESADSLLNTNQSRYHAASTQEFLFGPDATLIDGIDRS
jgi:hypothetical protein